MIQTECTACKQRFSVADDLAGQSVKCPRCQNMTPVPQRPGGQAGPSAMPPPNPTSAPPPPPPAPPTQPPLPSYQWMVAIGGKQEGPYQTEQLREMIGAGRVPKGALVWHEGLENWRPASDFPELGGPGKQGLGWIAEIFKDPLLLMTLRNPEDGFQEAGTRPVGPVALGVLITCLLLGILAWIPGAVKLGNLFAPDVSDEAPFFPGFGEGMQEKTEEVSGSVVKTILTEAIPRAFILQVLTFGMTLLLTAACVAALGKGPRVWYRSLVIFGLSLIPVCGALAAVFVLTWVHPLAFLLLFYSIYVWYIFYYQGLRTLGDVPAGKAAYSMPVIVGLGLVLPTFLYATSW